MGIFHLNQRRSKTQYFSDEVGILVDSRTVVETAEFVATGMLTYAEGDIIEIEIAEFDRFSLGEPVKVTIYSVGGIYTMNTSVIAKASDIIMILNPPETQKKFLGRREYPRVDTSSTGYIQAIKPLERAESMLLNEPLDIRVNNVSLNGIGFQITSETVELIPNQHVLEVRMEAGAPITCEVEVVRKEVRESHVYFGARILEMPQQNLNSYRAYILRTQVQHRHNERKAIDQSRLFNRK